jgi:hypothetical protein
VGRGSWQRPFSCFKGEFNGIGKDDRGIAEEGQPAREWNTNLAYPPHHTKFNKFRYDFYGHEIYKSFLDTWPEWAQGSTPSAPGKYRGGEYWIQFRQKISASRYQDANVQPNSNPDFKGFLQWSTLGTPSHELSVQDTNTPQGSWEGPETAADGGIVRAYTNQSDAKLLWKKPEGSQQLWQPGGDYNDTCIVTNGKWPTDVNACWHYAPDEWTCFLLHMIAGVEQGKISELWPNSIDPATATGVQLWACKQSEVDAARNEGRPARYSCIYNCTGENGFPFNYNNGQIHAGVTPNYNEPPPAWNALWLTCYQNNVPTQFGFTRKYCQVIFKRGNGGLDPYSDGIAPPRY